MIDKEIYLEKSITYTIKNTLFIKIILVIEYIMVFIESSNSVVLINQKADFNLGDSGLTQLNYLNPYYFLLSNLACQVDTYNQKICTFGNNNLFFLVFGIYFLMYCLYKIKYEKNYHQIEDVENSYLQKDSKILVIIINFFNIFMRPLLIFLIFINSNTIISSVLLMRTNGIFSFYLLLFLLSLFFLIFSTFLFYISTKVISLMFGYNEHQSHFDGLFSLKYDTFLLLIKIIIAFNNNFVLMNIYTIELNLFLNFIIIFTITTFTLIIIFDIFYKKIIFATNIDLNSLRLFLIIFNSFFLIYTAFFYENHKFILLMALSLLFNFIIAIFVTKYFLKKNMANIMNDKTLIYMLIYLYEILRNNENSNKIGGEFLMRHKLECVYLQKFLDTKEQNETDHNFITKRCLICESDDIEGIKLSTLTRQIKYNRLIMKNSLNKRDQIYFKTIGLFTSKVEEDIIKLVYKTNKILSKVTGDYRSFIKVFNNMISYRGENRESLSRFADMKKTSEITNLFSDAFSNLFSTYQIFKSSNSEIYNMTEKMSNLKLKIIAHLSPMIKKNKNFDHYQTILQKFIFENLFNDAKTYKGERNFYDFEDYLTVHFNENNNIEICYDSKNSLIIKNAPRQFIEFYGQKMENIFPPEIAQIQKEIFMKYLKSSSLNNFDFECYIKNLNDIKFISKARFSCKISYSMELTEFYISARYFPIDEEILVGSEDRDQIALTNISNKLGDFLFLSSENLKLYKKFGFRLNFEDIFIKTKESDKFEFNLNLYYIYYRKLLLELQKQYQYDDVNKILNKLNEDIKENTNKDNIYFKIIKKGTIKNSIFFSVTQIEETLEKEASVITKTNTDYVTDLIQQDYAGSHSSTTSFYNKDELLLDGRGKLRDKSKNESQEKLNTDKLTHISNSLVIFSILVILYCVFFMVMGILNNDKMNQSFLIKNQYDRLERTFYHTTAELLNIIVTSDKNSTPNLQAGESDYFNKHSAGGINPNITLNLLQFFTDETVTKVDSFLTNLLNYEGMIFNSYYQESISQILDRSCDYYSMTNVGGSLSTISKEYVVLDALKIMMSNIKTISSDPSYWQVLYIFTFKNGVGDFTNINTDSLTDYQLKTYEVLINYIPIFKILNEIRDTIDNFHTQNISNVFNQSFYLSYILLSIHLVLIIISIFLLTHLKQIMRFNISVISEVVTKETNFKLMIKKMEILKSLNKFYEIDPNSEARKLIKLRKDVNLQKKEEDSKNREREKNRDIAGLIVINDHKKINIHNQIFPLVKLIVLLLIIYYGYSFVCIYLLNIGSNDISTASYFIDINTKKFVKLLNKQNIMEVELLTNRTDSEIYNEINDVTISNIGYMPDTKIALLQELFEFEYYLKNSNLFAPVKQFLGTDLNCVSLYNLNDPILSTLASKYKLTNTTLNLRTSLTSICQQLGVLNNKFNNFIIEEIIYLTDKLAVLYLQSSNNYVKMRDILNSINLNDSFMDIIIILRPMHTYLTDTILYNIEVSCFNTFLLYSMAYLALNIIMDFVILFVYHYFIIRRIKEINQNLLDFIGIINIY